MVKSYTTLISTSELQKNLADPDWVVVDCRFSLQDTAYGRNGYEESHLPGSVYAHLDEDLSGAIMPGVTGRHPLPDPVAFAKKLSSWGIAEGIQVVAYDDMGGGVAARLWWMLHWLGHPTVAVLDGGWNQWMQENRPTTSDVPVPSPRTFIPHLSAELVVDAATVEAIRTNPNYVLFDARAAVRYRGEEEPIDPVAGHIPGAVSAPWPDNLDDAGLFLSGDALNRRFKPLLHDATEDHIVCYCGSGVTGAHDVLAMAAAGLGMPRLYAGSWSEWITDPTRPIATGDTP